MGKFSKYGIKMKPICEEPEGRRIRRLYEELQDPFVMMPIRSAATSLKNSFSEIEDYFNKHMGPDGVALKYWDVPTELLHEEKGYIIANVFVLAQVAIDQAVTIFTELRKYCNNGTAPPEKKWKILMFEPEKALYCSLNQIEVINYAANYFKHRHEWKDDWSLLEDCSQKYTILAVQNIGMKPEYFTENMERAVWNLDDDGDLNSIVNTVELWRERLAKKLLLELDAIGFVYPVGLMPMFVKLVE